MGLALVLASAVDSHGQTTKTSERQAQNIYSSRGMPWASMSVLNVHSPVQQVVFRPICQHRFSGSNTAPRPLNDLAVHDEHVANPYSGSTPQISECPSASVYAWPIKCKAPTAEGSGHPASKLRWSAVSVGSCHGYC